MDAYKEFQGKTLDSAIEAACSYYNSAREKLEIEIVNDAKTGIFGLVGAKKAKIRARRMQVSFDADMAGAADGASKPQSGKGRGRDDRRGKGGKPSDKGTDAAQQSAADKGTDKSVEKGADKGGERKQAQQNQRTERRQEPKPEQAAGTGEDAGNGDARARGPRSEGKNDERSRRSRGGRNNRKPRSEESPVNAAEDAAGAPVSAPSATPVDGDVAQDAAGDEARSSRRSRGGRRRSRGGRGRGKKDDSAAPETEQAVRATDAVNGGSDFEEGFDDDIIDDISHEPIPEANLAELDQDLLISTVTQVVEKLIVPVIGETPVAAEVEENRVKVTISSGDNSGLLIGREGQTLAAFQYLTNRIVAKHMGVAIRVQLDTGDYRERQDDKLREIALHLADKAKTLGKPQSTRPLSSYHRRIVHLALQGDEEIQTRSKGDGPMKRVIIGRKRKSA